MSIKVMSQVWEHSKHQSGALLVLLALADFAGADDGSRIFPGIDRLAAKARLSRRQTEKIISELLKTGELILVHRGGGRHEVSEYRIPMPLSSNPENPVILTGVEKPRHLRQETPSPMTRNPVAGDGPRVMNRNRTLTRARARGGDSISQVAFARKQLKAELAEIREEASSIKRPGGSAWPMPLDSEKVRRLGVLMHRRQQIERELGIEVA